ncbi:MAG: hypothetical protein LC113_13670 [Acidobacteria bacterium]|nr:hypothetical protein [Acidobacteriota bacterium]
MRHCEYTDSVLDFVYDELDASARSEFEEHLAGCDLCAEDVGAITASSFAVREWRQEEFEPLAPPRFVIPVAAAPKWSIAGLLGLFKQPVFAMSAAAVLLAIGIGTYFIVNLSTRPLQIDKAEVAPPASVEKPTAPAPTAGPLVAAVPKDEQPVAEAPEERTSNAVRSPKPLRTAPKVSRNSERPQISSHVVADNVDHDAAVPVSLAGEVPETQDRSLRLTDLFADESEDRGD